MIKVRTLQQRFVVYMLLPVALLLIIMGSVGFIFARRALIAQWEEAAILKLQRAAHHVDMRLARPKAWIDLYLQFVEGHPHALKNRQDILRKLETHEGVVAVYLNPAPPTDPSKGKSTRTDYTMMADRRHGPMEHLQGRVMRGHRFTITEPQVDPDSQSRTVSLITRAESANPVNSVEIRVVLDFDYLLTDIPRARWVQSRKTFLLDGSGQIFASMASDGRKQLGETGDNVEIKTLAALKESDFGTLRGSGHPPRQVSGYYRLEEAPWYIVVIAPGTEILKPIIRFRNYYFLILAISIMVVLILIKRVTTGLTDSVRTLSGAAEAIAKGELGNQLPVKSEDEIGGLTRSFNTMIIQLKDRLRLRQSLDMAKEVQQSLLPETTPQVAGLDIAGRSIYCEETGGDYFDYLHADEALHVVVGDVAGHGISAALLMSSVRASLRQCYCEIEDIGGQISNLNRSIAMDVGDSGRFVTLFYLVVNPNTRRLRWVRAGHDPAMIYCRAKDEFEDLGGEGVALGIDGDFHYLPYIREGLQKGDIILVGTDGIWEACDETGAMYGKKNLHATVRHHRDDSAQEIIDAVVDSVHRHIGNVTPTDDITLVVIKIA
ncbi:MAG: SpoIIE family protein phosphatase [Desulfobacterales bacterium]|jgi:sigma-B regulation protein RsbU (phosphoserine phosphatase)